MLIELSRKPRDAAAFAVAKPQVIKVAVADGRTFEVGFAADLTISWLKAQVAECTGITVTDQNVFVCGLLVTGDPSFDSCGIRAGCTVQVVVKGPSAVALWQQIAPRLAGRQGKLTYACEQGEFDGV